MVLMNPNRASLDVNEPAILGEAETSRDADQSIDARGRKTRRHRAWASGESRLAALDVGPGRIEFDADDEVPDLLIDAHLAATKEAVHVIIEQRIQAGPVLHAHAVAGVTADIDAGPIVDGRRGRNGLHGKIGSLGRAARANDPNTRRHAESARESAHPGLPHSGITLAYTVVTGCIRAATPTHILQMEKRPPDVQPL